MNILILNGSPAGNSSITLQTVEYLKALNPNHEYVVLHIGQQIRQFERDFSEARKLLERAELIVFCYPVYTFLVPAQMHRFIELMKDCGIDFTAKYATQITTSKHFYDTTAHRFIEDNCADLKLRLIRGLSADMDDLLTKKGQKEARDYFQYVMWNIHEGYYERPSAEAVNTRFKTVRALEINNTAEINSIENDDNGINGVIRNLAVTRDTNLRIALVTDYNPAAEVSEESEKNSTLISMINRFRKSFPGECEIVNLHDFPFAGGCLGCFRCALSGKCIYKDGFESFLREHINNADAIVYAFMIKDHSMGYRFKLFDDRQFCNGHRTVTMGKPVGYLVVGDIMAEENLRTIIAAKAEVGGNFLAGIASDMVDTDWEVDQLVHRLVYATEQGYTPPKNFYGVGGLKIFRDLIYEMQGMMREDHRFYKEHGFYDYPQKKRGKILMIYLVGMLLGSPKLMKKSNFNISDGMLIAYRKVIDNSRK